MPPCDTSEAVRWLMEGARTAQQPEEVLRQLGERMVDCGVPLAGAAVFVRTLHPGLYGRCFLWRRGRGVLILEFPYDSEESIALQRSVEAGIRASDTVLTLDPDCEDSCLNIATPPRAPSRCSPSASSSSRASPTRRLSSASATRSAEGRGSSPAY